MNSLGAAIANAARFLHIWVDHVKLTLKKNKADVWFVCRYLCTCG